LLSDSDDFSTDSYGQAETRRWVSRFLFSIDRVAPGDTRLLGPDTKDESSGEPKLGFRSTLVLAKLGYDLREQYNGSLDEPLTPQLEQVLERLLGPGADVETLDDHKRTKMQS
jgi:hypothetical protein